MWLHFTKLDADNAIWNICNTKCKAGNGNTYNLKKHLIKQDIFKTSRVLYLPKFRGLCFPRCRKHGRNHGIQSKIKNLTNSVLFRRLNKKQISPPKINRDINQCMLILNCKKYLNKNIACSAYLCANEWSRWFKTFKWPAGKKGLSVHIDSSL